MVQPNRAARWPPPGPTHLCDAPPGLRARWAALGRSIPSPWSSRFVGSPPSPRVRGAAVPRLGYGLLCGTVPAGAGSSRTPLGVRPPVWDRPRGCGEQIRPTAYRGSPGGPSPRVRGADAEHQEDLLGVGTIPAGAGSSWSRWPSTSSCRDHPRGCGEQWRASSMSKERLGPSPRVRGAGDRQHRGHLRAGTIPAGAGSSLRQASLDGGDRDHPRGCGEQFVMYRLSAPT